mmetsp:Transcript_19883/g.46692  ORF Transcript_19883/g.46692 Transcript_19883/m.46692 type:complete len:591 (-) Transcript_19883:141-1913(-)
MKIKSLKTPSFRKKKDRDVDSDAPGSSSAESTPGGTALAGDGASKDDASGNSPPPAVTPITPPDSPIAQSARSEPSQPTQPNPLRLGSFNFENPQVEERDASRLSNTNFPSLYDEASDMVTLSNLIYSLAELRDLARNGVLNDPTRSLRILEMPLPLGTALSIIKSEGPLLREILSDGKHDATLSALESLLERQKQLALKAEMEDKLVPKEEEEEHKNDGMFGWMTSWDGCLAGGMSFDEVFCGKLSNVADGLAPVNPGAGASDGAIIYACSDLKSQEELVFGIGINPAEERITIVFRGSVTKTDFLADANISLARAPHPRDYAGQTTSEELGEAGIHKGFYDYLFSENGKPSKYVEIMKQLERLYAESPSRREYKIYVTGHSLGGALATLFGYYASCSTTLPVPITVVSVASPRVGNLSFAKSFVELESKGRLRHLRIVNHKDPVPLGPTFSSKRALTLSAMAFSPLGYLALKMGGLDASGEDEYYYHTGIKVKLYRDVSQVGTKRVDIKYSSESILASTSGKPAPSDKEELKDIEESNKRKEKGSSDLPMISYHYGSAYSDRIAIFESDLSGLTLNDIYKEKAHTAFA